MVDIDPAHRLDAKEAKDRLGTIVCSMAPELLLIRPINLKEQHNVPWYPSTYKRSWQLKVGQTGYVTTSNSCEELWLFFFPSTVVITISVLASPNVVMLWYTVQGRKKKYVERSVPAPSLVVVEFLIFGIFWAFQRLQFIKTGSLLEKETWLVQHLNFSLFPACLRLHKPQQVTSKMIMYSRLMIHSAIYEKYDNFIFLFLVTWSWIQNRLYGYWYSIVFFRFKWHNPTTARSTVAQLLC